MSENEKIIVALRNQLELLEDLVEGLEKKEVLSVEDFSYVESRTDEIAKNLISVRRLALDKMIQGVSWFQTESF